jgi:hypothetical protein
MVSNGVVFIELHRLWNALFFDKDRFTDRVGLDCSFLPGFNQYHGVYLSGGNVEIA